MNESAKNRLIIALSILCVLFLLASIKSCSNAYRQKGARDKEMANRLDLEEKTSGLVRDKQIADEKLSAKEKELAQEAAARQAAQKALEQEQTACQSLKDELQKANSAKIAAEEQIKQLTSKNKK